jgi:DNA-binding NarL/FixJ family response regulator
MKLFPLLLLCLLASAAALSQPADQKALLKALASRNSGQLVANQNLLLDIWNTADSAGKVRLLAFLDEHVGSSDAHAAARSLLWKGVILHRPPFLQTTAPTYMLQAINRAVESGDAYLQVECMEIYADDCRSTGKSEAALFYYLKAIELRRVLNDTCFRYRSETMEGTVGDLLHKMQEYGQSTPYLLRSLPYIKAQQLVSAYNTVGLNYQRLNRGDSAQYWYNRALAAATQLGDSVWKGIVSGNIGSLLFEQGRDAEALPLLWQDYQSCLQTEPKNAGNTLHRIALICLRRQQADSARQLARQALQLVQLGRGYNAGFVRNIYRTLAEVYKKTGPTDSAFHYSDAYHRLNDSLLQAVAANRADVAQARLDFEKNSHRIEALLKEKKAEKTWRNLLLAALALLLIAGWLFFRWQRQRHLTQQQALLHQQQMAEAEANNAREQLAAFARNSIEKNELIEKLQTQLQQQHQQINEELQHQSILTENDWLRFKEMFDKAHPSFMARLKSMAPDITTAEIRLAALAKLNLGNKHIASMLGIGTDAVRKTKSRLRQRLQIDTETDLEDFLKQIAIQ